MLMKYLVNRVEGAAELGQGALLVIRSLKERREGISEESHVANDKKTLVAELTEHLLGQEAKQHKRGLSLISLFRRFCWDAAWFLPGGFGKR